MRRKREMSKPKAEILKIKADVKSPVLDSMESRLKRLVKCGKALSEVSLY